MNYFRSSRSYLQLLSLLMLALMMSACATPAKVDSMSIPALDRSQFQADRPLSGRVSIGTVTGGKDTNPMWTSEIGSIEFESALRDSLETARLFNTHALSEYELDAELVKVDQPLIGFTFNVKTEVLYTLRNRESRETVVQQTINAVGTATTGDSFVGVKRLRIATERSAQENIKSFIDVLYNFEVH